MTERATVAIVGAGPTGLLLAGDLARAGVEVTVLERIERDAQVTTVHQDADGVDLGVGGAVVRADYAVGADGVRSVVPDALGLPFPGKSVLTSIMLADVRLTHAPEDVLAVNAVAGTAAGLRVSTLRQRRRATRMSRPARGVLASGSLTAD
jgi:2-polyprenyl-6-methoxyphenol hydroxylase-like FAD-dependent oxidoreductase